MTTKTKTVRAGGRRQKKDTRQRILDSAEKLVQERGFNAFSYADVAGELGITKASLHYHFPGKGALGQALIARYAQRFARALDEIDSNGGQASVKLAQYAELYGEALRGRRMCLCGMLAAEYRTLPEPIRNSVVAFFDHNESWLEDVLSRGRGENALGFEGSPRDAARMILSGLEGAMLLARPYGDLARFQSTAATLLASLVPPVKRASSPAPTHGQKREIPAQARRNQASA